MEEPCDVPDLLNIFTKIVCERKDYCFVCLRTRDERRLVVPESFKKFVAAVKINTNGTAHFVCHICERQASNALRLFRAAVFASSLGLILSELCKRDIKCNKILLERKFFKRILTKVELSKNLTPNAINEEVRQIRNNNLLSETDTLVMDNKQIYEAAPTPTVVAITTGQAEINNTEVFRDAVVQCPIAQRCTTPSILPDRDVTEDEINQHENPSPPETYVILDDEDDPLRTPPSTHTEKEPEENQPPVNKNILTAVSNLNNNLVITLDPPNLVTFEHLLAQQSTKYNNFLLHPIFLTETGDMNVPSLSAVIINDLLIFQDALKQTQHSRPLKINMDIVKHSLKANREVFIQNCNTFRLPAMNSNLVNLFVDKGCQSDFPLHPKKKMKIDGPILHGALVSEKGNGNSSKMANSSMIKEVKISDISSDMDGVARVNRTGESKTDWEDKIPMDVISFVDAVDPNAPDVLQEAPPGGCGGVRVGDVRSLARGPDVIDLC